MTSRRTGPVTLLAILGCLVGCGPAAPPASDAAALDAPPASATSALPIALQETGVEVFDIVDFDAVHGRAADNGPVPIFGALPVGEPEPGVPVEAAAFLGRWEGYGLGPPIKRDWKFVLAVTEIDAREGQAYLWAGTNMQFPPVVERVHFRVNGSGAETAIEWEQTVNGAYAVVSLRHATGTDALEGSTDAADQDGRLGPVLLRRDSTAQVVYQDYAAHLADLGITWQPHDDPSLAAAGAGSLVYLPPGYDAEPERAWPLIVFFHGSGDRGDNGLVLAQNSPFRFITAGNPLDAIVVAPLLAEDQPAFPGDYLDGVLDDALARYRVDPSRVTLTGLSMGGEATYRLARHRPQDVAAIAVLCGFEATTFPAAAGWGYPEIAEPPSSLAGMPVRVIHGRDDMNVPVAAAEAAVAALEAGGAEVELIVLDHHDHDVWTDTYADPALFEWLLAQRAANRP